MPTLILPGLCIQKQPQEVFYIKAVLKIFGIFTGKHPKIQVNVVKFLRTTILKKISANDCFCVLDTILFIFYICQADVEIGRCFTIFQTLFVTCLCLLSFEFVCSSFIT